MDDLKWMGAVRIIVQIADKNTDQAPFTSENVKYVKVLLVNYREVFNQLFELSFWWHPFTAKYPLVSKWCNANFLQNLFWWRYKLIYILDGLWVGTLSANLFFCMKFSFKSAVWLQA